MKIIGKKSNERCVKNLTLYIMQAMDYSRHRFLNLARQHAEGWTFNEYWKM